LGLDWSGVQSDGKRVAGFNYYGGLKSFINKSSVAIMWNVPDDWSLEDAATISLVYLTVYSVFFGQTDIREAKSILIHSGAGGVGQAALEIAFAYGLEVFTTVGSKEKRDFLLTRYPKLKPQNIGNSRDTSFVKMIALETKGEGVDLVLNSLSGDKLQASIKCLAKCGKFFEIGKFDMMSRTKIDMRHFAKDISFASMFLENQRDNKEKVNDKFL
jgi:fatty acid synthase